MAVSIAALVVAVAIITNGLLAGLFFVFACAIGPGFRHIDDRGYVRAFRSINTTILNGWFLSVFFVAPRSVGTVGTSAAPSPALPRPQPWRSCRTDRPAPLC